MVHSSASEYLSRMTPSVRQTRGLLAAGEGCRQRLAFWSAIRFLAPEHLEQPLRHGLMLAFVPNKPRAHLTTYFTSEEPPGLAMELCRSGLAAVAITAISGDVLAGQMVIRLGVQGTPGERLLQAVKHAAIESGLRIGVPTSRFRDRLEWRDRSGFETPRILSQPSRHGDRLKKLSVQQLSNARVGIIMRPLPRSRDLLRHARPQVP